MEAFNVASEAIAQFDVLCFNMKTQAFCGIILNVKFTNDLTCTSNVNEKFLWKIFISGKSILNTCIVVISCYLLILDIFYRCIYSSVWHVKSKMIDDLWYLRFPLLLKVTDW